MNCLECSVLIEGRTLRAKFCGPSCAQKYRYRNRKVPRPEIDCATCSEKFTPTRITHRFCSKECVTKNWKSEYLTPELRRNHMLRHKYGLTSEQWNLMFIEQNSSCRICGSSSPGHGGAWATDHDHETGEVRGILCNTCNLGLGYFKDNPDFLISAVAYLLQSVNVLELR